MTLNQKDPNRLFFYKLTLQLIKVLTSPYTWLDFISCIGRYRCFYLRYSKCHYKQCKVFILGECSWIFVF